MFCLFKLLVFYYSSFRMTRVSHSTSVQRKRSKNLKRKWRHVVWQTSRNTLLVWIVNITSPCLDPILKFHFVFCLETSTYLTDSTVSFVRSYVRFCDDLLRMCVDAHLQVVQSAFVDIFQAHFKHLEACWKNERYIDSVRLNPVCFHPLLFAFSAYLPNIFLPFSVKISLKTFASWCSRFWFS